MRTRLIGALVVVMGLLGLTYAGPAPGPGVKAATAADNVPVSFVADAAAAHNNASPSVVVPTSVQAGDRLVMVLSLNADQRQVGAPTGVTGWAVEGDRAASTMRTYVWSKVAAAGDAGARVTVPVGATTKATLHVAAYRGVVDGPLTVASQAHTTASTQRSTPVVAAPEGAWVLSYWASKSEATSAWDAPAEVTERRQVANSGGGRIASLLADSGAPVPLGDYGGLVATSNASSTKATTWSVVLPGALPAGNLPPTAQFSQTCTGLTCSFDGSGSSDPEDALTSWTWDLGNGTTDAGPTVQVTYATGGSYQVSLTVTDDAGLSDVETRTVNVSAGGVGPSVVTPDVETDPVFATVDAADDPAIWVHPSDPGQSLVIGNDKQGALEVYDLDGSRIQRITTGTRFWGNVDVRQGVTVGGRTLDLVAAYNNGIRTFDVAAATRQLVAAGDGSTASINTNGGEGLCAYVSPSTGQVHVFVITRPGRLRQYRLHDSDGDGRIQGTMVREFFVGSESEGCFADDVHGHLYVSEEDVGLWRYGAEPETGSTRVMVDRVRPDGNLAFDVEGVTLADTGGGDGYLIVSAQNGASASNSYFAVYDRRTNAYLWSFSVEAGPNGDGCERTDGIAAQTGDLGPRFPHGVFICQDNGNTSPAPGNQNFKLVALDKILPAG
jgi:myo-inositol-hexaphosphate 3-phosphohydrolase